MLFSDTHCHFDFKEFSSTLPQLYQACVQQNIKRIVIPGITAKQWPRVLETCQKFHGVFPALGLHPWWINKAKPSDLVLLEQYIKTQTLVGVGEIGIDGGIENIPKQIEYFTRQLALANKYALPTIIHHRKSHQYILPILKQHVNNNGGVIHAFSGSYQQAIDYINLGYKLGIGGTITYERAKKTRNAIKRLPIESLVLETDAPAMPLAGFQGTDNSPLRILDVFNCLADLRSEGKEQLAEQLEQNVDELFSLNAKS